MIFGASAERIYCLKTINPGLLGSLSVKSNLITVIVRTGGFTVPRPFVSNAAADKSLAEIMSVDHEDKGTLSSVNLLPSGDCLGGLKEKIKSTTADKTLPE